MSDSYGPSVGIEDAKKAAAAAIAEARRNGWKMTVAITDTGGELVYLEKMNDCQTGSVRVAISKSRSAALFKRPTKAFQDMFESGYFGGNLAQACVFGRSVEEINHSTNQTPCESQQITG